MTQVDALLFARVFNAAAAKHGAIIKENTPLEMKAQIINQAVMLQHIAQAFAEQVEILQ